MNIQKFVIVAAVFAFAGPIALLSRPQAFAPGEGPCPLCKYDNATQTLTGSIDSNYVDHDFPLTQMTLKLVTQSTSETYGPLSPSSMEVNTNISQQIDTSLTNVVAAYLEWKCG